MKQYKILKDAEVDFTKLLEPIPAIFLLELERDKFLQSQLEIGKLKELKHISKDLSPDLKNRISTLFASHHLIENRYYYKFLEEMEKESALPSLKKKKTRKVIGEKKIVSKASEEKLRAIFNTLKKNGVQYNRGITLSEVDDIVEKDWEKGYVVCLPKNSTAEPNQWGLETEIHDEAPESCPYLLEQIVDNVE